MINGVDRDATDDAFYLFEQLHDIGMILECFLVRETHAT
jgi:hypothetical protein